MDEQSSVQNLDASVARFALAAPNGAQRTAAAQLRLALSFRQIDRVYHPAAMDVLDVLLAHARFGWSESFRDQAFATPRLVLASDLCNACITVDQGRPLVLIGLGLLRALAYFQEWVHLGARAGPWLETEGGLTADETHDLLYASFLPLVGHLRDGRSLPRPGSFLIPADRTGCFVGLATAAQFLLMHEIGHAALGHCDGGIGPVSFFMLETDAAIAPHHSQELEADRFVFEALRPRFRQFTAAYGFNVMMLAALLERHLGSPASHPIAPARMLALIERLGKGRAADLAEEYDGLMEWFAALPNQPASDVEGETYAHGCEQLAKLQAAYDASRIEDVPSTEPVPDDRWETIAASLWGSPARGAAG